MKRWQDPSWVEEMRLELDFNLMMAPPLDPGAGIIEEEIKALIPMVPGNSSGPFEETGPRTTCLF